MRHATTPFRKRVARVRVNEIPRRDRASLYRWFTSRLKCQCVNPGFIDAEEQPLARCPAAQFSRRIYRYISHKNIDAIRYYTQRSEDNANVIMNNIINNIAISKRDSEFRENQDNDIELMMFNH